MADQQLSSPPPIDMRSPSINITESSREGVINVMFHMDLKILDWLFNTFYDSHIETSGGSENQTIDAVPNATYYLCPVCKAHKNKEASVVKSGYLLCSGTKVKPHQSAYTTPMDWKPILKKTGLYYLLGQANSSLNANIATANLSVGEADLARKYSLEDRLSYISWYLSYSMIAVVVGQYHNYVADWVINEKKLHSVFSVGFCTNFIISMSNNIKANSTKGKGMAAAGKVMDTHISSEARTHHEIDYQYPAGYAMQQKQSIGDRMKDMFKIG